MKIIKIIGLVLLIAFVVAQFFRPEKNAGELTSVNAFLAETNPPEDVKVILKETCFDCHSSHTKYPWYSNITPVNYWLADHIKSGTKRLNFSLWKKYSTKRKDHKLDEVIDMVEDKEMPLPSYTWTHGDAKLSQEQIDAVITWAKQVRMGYALTPQPE